MLKNVSIETVKEFVSADINSNLGSHKMGITGSYLQTERHSDVSPKFQVIQPAAIGAAMAERGYSLVSMLTGKGRHTDKVDFQRTISRYRGADIFGLDNLSLDIIYVSKHLGRGCDELRLGLYRGVCANQWTAGTLFEIFRFRHNGNAVDNIETGIAAILAQRAKLTDLIERMRNTVLSAGQIEELCKRYADARLADKQNVIKVDFRRLATVHRTEDAKTDLFTVANVLQENVIRMPLAYDIQAVDGQGRPYERHMNTRRFRESSAQLVDLNATLFDIAAEYAAA